MLDKPSGYGSLEFAVSLYYLQPFSPGDVALPELHRIRVRWVCAAYDLLSVKLTQTLPCSCLIFSHLKVFHGSRQ